MLLLPFESCARLDPVLPEVESELVRRAHYQQGAVSDSELASMGVLKMVTTQQARAHTHTHEQTRTRTRASALLSTLRVGRSERWPAP